MKILQVIPSLAPGFGGPTNAVLGLSSALAGAGLEVAIFTTDADVRGRLSVSLETPVNIGEVKVYYFPVQYPRHYKFSLPLLKALKKHIPYFDIVHIHSLFQFSTLAAAYYCRKFNKPYIIRPLGQLDPLLLKRHRLVKWLYLRLFERKNLERARAIHFTTEEERRLSGELGLEAKAIVAGLGLDLDEFRTLPEYGVFRLKYPQLKDKKIILFLGRINFKKGLDILVKAFAQLARIRQDVYLVIAGPDDEGYGKKVKLWLTRDGLLPRVIFTGMLLGRDKLAALRDSDIFVLPSYSENFGLSVVEAMACGLAVIISNKVNIVSEIQEEGAGLVIDLDPVELSRAMHNLLEDPQLRRTLSDKGQELVRKKFIWERIAKQLIQAYQGILNESFINPASGNCL